MRKRLNYLLATLLLTMLLFIIAKVVFTLVCLPTGMRLSFVDMISVIAHGLSLDFSTSLYIIIIPFLTTIAAIWVKLPRWTLIPYYAIISIALSLAFVADCSLYEFWQFKLDASCLTYLSTPKEAMASVSTGYLLLHLLIVIALSCLFCMAYLLPYYRYLLKAEHISRRSSGNETIIGLLCIPLLVIGIRGGISESTTNIGQVYYSQNQFLNHAAVNPVFSFFASFEKTANYIPDYHFMDDKVCEQIVNEYFTMKEGNTDTLLNTQRPNVVVVLMESCGAVFTKLGGHADIMPRLNELMEEGICFDSCYANSWRTDRGTVCTYSGYPSFPVSSPMKMPSKMQFLPGLANSLVDEGYLTHYVYGGDINFTNMRSYLILNGFSKLTWMDNYTIEEQHTSQWGVQDHITFKTVESLICQYHAEQNPFFIGFSTLSSHEPWTVPVEKFQDEVSNAFYYLDQCIGRLVDSLRQTPAWENLLIIFLPDHGYPYNGLNEYHQEFNHIPMLWVGGAVKKVCHVTKVCSQTDLVATLLGQMGIAHDSFHYSRNVLSKSYNKPIAVHTFNNGISVVDATGFAVYSLDTHKILVNESKEAKQLIKVGKAVLQSATKDFKELSHEKK